MIVRSSIFFNADVTVIEFMNSSLIYTCNPIATWTFCATSYFIISTRMFAYASCTPECAFSRLISRGTWQCCLENYIIYCIWSPFISFIVYNLAVLWGTTRPHNDAYDEESYINSKKAGYFCAIVSVIHSIVLNI